MRINKNNCMNWLKFFRDIALEGELKERFNKKLAHYLSNSCIVKEDVNHYFWQKVIEGEKYVKRTNPTEPD